MERVEFKIGYNRAEKIINTIISEVVNFTYAGINELDEMVFECEICDASVTLKINKRGDRIVEYWDYRTSGDIWRTIRINPLFETAEYVKRVF